MTDNTQELDELLYQFSNYWRGNDLDTLPKLSPERAKQAIQELIDRKVKEALDERQKSKS